MRTLVVVPTYNEAGNVLRVVEGLFDAEPTVEVLVVDDDSPDGTGSVVARARESEPRLHLLSRPGKLGLGTAYLAGFQHGLERGFDRFVTMDCDLSHDPAALPDLLGAMDRFDMVIGSRYVDGGGVSDWSLPRRALSRFANLYTRVLLRLPVRDCTSGYRCYSRKVLENARPFDIRASGYSFLEEMVWRVHRCGFRIGEVPIIYVVRSHGTSKIDRQEIYRAAWHVIATAFKPPPRRAEPR
jgi:glycosyltransferase involved in cell wall biosynthesis